MLTTLTTGGVAQTRNELIANCCGVACAPHFGKLDIPNCVRPLSLFYSDIGRWSGKEIARSTLSLARSAQAERDNESCFFVRAASVHRFIRCYQVKNKDEPGLLTGKDVRLGPSSGRVRRRHLGVGGRGSSVSCPRNYLPRIICAAVPTHILADFPGINFGKSFLHRQLRLLCYSSVEGGIEIGICLVSESGAAPEQRAQPQSRSWSTASPADIGLIGRLTVSGLAVHANESINLHRESIHRRIDYAPPDATVVSMRNVKDLPLFIRRPERWLKLEQELNVEVSYSKPDEIKAACIHPDRGGEVPMEPSAATARRGRAAVLTRRRPSAALTFGP
ncbi:hypothetical protein EVAR_81765_1 [Eumeta japonica]|uniref:Uncharacterized protein n=1 Tax=Eumeta variegata TaxID=151549 RepID=A0A4C1UHC5_EUMVA|nr:hypothetical protein EVAR_81765_1 [Eumeta japonica]